ncbi:uncharacterized protein LOC132787860 isoform X3 [Drosophila nasuta]|uniref:uncharacterized protein LOC132787860 isoform X3 n=1 Tax=Drosophila nasuta TaxID=42062 RepID=UPI00295F52C6|nr:uncharacterized protein LOC132787860 isoform X3 [Drosophila nasuta]
MFIIFHFHSRYAEQDSKQKQSTKQRGTKRNNNGVGTIYMWSAENKIYIEDSKPKN